jgi:hypothetical protein
MTDLVAIGGGRFEVHATSDSHFSWVRTRLSLERTAPHGNSADWLWLCHRPVLQPFGRYARGQGRLPSKRAEALEAGPDFLRQRVRF